MATLLVALMFAMPVAADQPSRGRGSSGAPDPGASTSGGPDQKGVTAAYSRTIRFSGYDWEVKTSGTGRTGPGPNYFSDTSENVWVDSSGRLHLRITKRNGRWYSAEVISTTSFGYGTYRWYLDSPVDNLDPNVVLGLFTWNDDPAYNHRELDIEFSRWGNPNYANAQYTVQPYTVAGNQVTFTEPPLLNQTTHSLQWAAGSAAFRSLRGHYASAPNPGAVIAQQTFTKGIPVAGGENARMNLWLFEGRQPSNRQSVEIIVNKFEFAP
jgi:hypothetical protein